MNSRKPTVAYGATYTTDAEAERLVSVALDAGYRTINACLAYHNIRGMGQAITKSGIPRDELAIAVLDENERRSSESGNGFDSYIAETQQVYDSLKWLGIEQIDLFMINWPVPRYMEESWRELNANSWRALEDCVDRGLIKRIGVSNFLPAHLEELKKTARLPIAANQLEVHPQFQQRGTVQHCEAKGIEVQAWAPLFKGKSLKLLIVQEIARKYGKTEAQIILRWDIQHGISPVVNSCNETRIHQNFDIFSFELSQDDMARIDGLEDGEHVMNYSYQRQVACLRGMTL
jgi:diketogulonate reductase-like aldo/keto reductase